MLKQVQHDVRSYTRVFADVFSAPRSTLLFSHYSLLITQSSLLIAQCSLLKGVCKDAKPEGRIAAGFLNPWNNWQDKEVASAKTRTATLTTDSRLCRRHYCVVIKNRGLKSPRLFIFPSFRRFFVNHSTFRRFHSLLTTHRSQLKAIYSPP